KYISAFSSEPLLSYGTTQFLLKQVELMQQTEPTRRVPSSSLGRSPDHAVDSSLNVNSHIASGGSRNSSIAAEGAPFENIPREAPFAPPARSRKKFVIRDQEEPDNIVVQQKPPTGALVPLTKLSDCNDLLFVTKEAILQIFD